MGDHPNDFSSSSILQKYFSSWSRQIRQDGLQTSSSSVRLQTQLSTWRNFFLSSLSCLEFEWKVIFKSNLSQHFQSTNFDWNREKLTQTLGKWAEELEGIQQSCPTNLNSEEWGCWTTSIWIHTTEVTRFEEILNIEKIKSKMIFNGVKPKVPCQKMLGILWKTYLKERIKSL